MKIGTISLNINAPDFNYGAILHSWAFQQYLLKLSFVDGVEIIDYTMPKLEGQFLKYPALHSLIHFHLKDALRKAIRAYKHAKRYDKFQKFIKEHMIISSKPYTQSSLNKADLQYDTVICESDVIWSPGFSGGHFDKSFFLALDSMKKCTRIAYAPSMANGDLNHDQEQELIELLPNLDAISCRESYEKEILQQYTNKEVTHVLDPVMLLEKEDYDAITGERPVKERYLLIYLPVDDNKKLRYYAAEYAKKYELKIVEITTTLKDKAGIVTLTTAGIEEFLACLKYADCIFTNSFHAICFSIIYNKNFYAFSRTYAGKVQDICHTMGLDNRYFSDDTFIEQSEVDYTLTNQIWLQKKKASMEWLKNALLSTVDNT